MLVGGCLRSVNYQLLVMGRRENPGHRRRRLQRVRSSIQLTPVYVSLEGFPRSESLRTTGYCPGFVGSMIPGVAIVWWIPDGAGDV